MSPHGLDVRLSLDLSLQQHADELLLGHPGAVILLNAQTGEILVMSSQPTFNPNHLNEIGPQLNKDPQKPLINRAVQGVYPAGSMIEPFTRAFFDKKDLSEQELRTVYEAFGFNRQPQLQIETAAPFFTPQAKDLLLSPLQAALAAAALSNHGRVPAPRIALSVNTPAAGWVVLPTSANPFEAVQESAANKVAQSFAAGGTNYWSHVGRATGDESSVTWFLGGTPPNWQATPLVVVVTIEEDNERLARLIGQKILTEAMNP